MEHQEINAEVDKIVYNRWQFLNDNWPNIAYRYKHRSELKHVKLINEIKKILFNKLGYIAVFYFLVVLYGSVEYPGPYYEIEKGLFLLFHLVSGISGIEIERYLPYSTFHRMYKKFWMDEDNYKRIDKIVTQGLSSMFSSTKLRVLSAHLHNPDLFKHVTLIIDGHDSCINYVNTDIKREKLYSYKFKKNSIRTQIVADINDMILFTSRSEYCAESSDGSMFLNMKLYQKMTNYDTLATDGGYSLFVNQFIEKASEKGYDFSKNNFVYPIRKEINVNLDATELHFNDVFGSFRSKIENQFAELGNKFYRFNNNKSVVKMDNIKFYNLQFRMACLLKNIQKFSDKFGIKVQPHHMLWESSDFEFPVKEKLLDIVISSKKEQKESRDNMIELQKKLLSLDISDDMVMDDYSDNDKQNEESDDDFEKFNERSRSGMKKRKRKQKEKVDLSKMREVVGVVIPQSE
ncbi:predicted protein [Lichtheimia corymbifera JMRC:FSU:9682]|uniref:DDE Tnp4 domain-containing protein n=1 Tax=Lichtheimia corymbifera JMRC:FSU:9682 TaxID=1263082 RepID=A0A068SGV6_9FUNG|nr:predicted protein [Lichtheimia corymbifera JMRC:FSU:9682]